MNWLDITIIVIVVVATFMGWRMGVLRAAATLVGLVGGVYLSSVYHQQAADVLGQFITNEQFATIAGYAVVFLLVMAAAFAIGGVIRRLLHLIFLGWVDGVAGAGVGFIVSVGVLMALLVPLRNSSLFGLGDTIQNSSVANILVEASPQVEGMLPSSFDSMTRFLSGD